MAPTRWGRVVGLVAVGVALLAGCGGGTPESSRPVVVSTVPSSAPLGIVGTILGAPGQPMGVACSHGPGGDKPGARSTRGLVTVDADPAGAVLVWEPGLNSRTCRDQLTRMGAHPAAVLAAAIDAEPAFPPGVYSCPADDGAGVVAYLTYAGRGGAEVASVALTACAVIGAPGRAVRRVGGAVLDALRPFAPPAWERHVDR